MPGTFVINTAATLSAALLMGSSPKYKFQTTEQDIAADGQRKWEIQAALTWLPEHGMRPVSEVVSVTCLGGTDPAASLPPGTAIEFIDFRVGVSQAERTDRGVRGGKPYYQASGVRPLNGRPGKAE